MLKFLQNSEVVLGTIPLAATLLTVAWKMVGASFIPGFDAMWGGKDDQYPRTPGDEKLWDTIYLLMYGLFGTAAQCAGLSLQKANN